MTTEAPASALPTSPVGALSIAAAAQILDSQETAAKATPAISAPVETAAQTDTATSQEAAPDAVEDGIPEADNEPLPEEAESDEERDEDPDGDYVELDDGKRVGVAELVNAYKRESATRDHMRRKDEALAEERRVLESQRQTIEQTVAETTRQVAAREAELARIASQVEAEAKRYQQGLADLQPILNANEAQWDAFDWEAFADTATPQEFNRMQANYQKFQRSKAQLVAERAEVDRKFQESAQAQVQKAKAILHEHITTKHPDLKDPVKGDSLWRDMAATAESVGYTSEVILGSIGQTDDPNVRIADPATFNLWIKATLYDRLMKETKAASQPAADAKPEPTRMRVVKGDAPRPRPRTVERARVGGVSAAFNAKPTIENALRVLEAQDAYQARRRG